MNKATKFTMSRIMLSFIIFFLLVFPWEDIGLAFPTFLVLGKVVVDLKYLIAGFLFLLASFTDYFDGIIARKEKKITSFGTILDSVADKVLVDGLLIILAYNGFVSLIVPIIVVLRDLIMDGMRMVAMKEGVTVKENKWGKVKTAFLLIGLVLLLFYNLPFEIWGIYVAEIFLYFGAILSILSAIFYGVEWKKKVKLD